MLNIKNYKPIAETLGLCCIFVTLGSCRVILTKLSVNKDGQYDYMPVTVNVCAEFIKLTVCLLLTAKLARKDKSVCIQSISCNRAGILDLLKWSIPGAFYFVDNLLAFYIIKYFQPAVVVLLGNFVIITTSLLFRLVLKRLLSRIQWASLLVLFFSIVALSKISQSHVPIDGHRHHISDHIFDKSPLQSEQNDTSLNNGYQCIPHHTQVSVSTDQNISQEVGVQLPESPNGIEFHEGHMLIILQCFISSSANIYNEKIFKEGKGLEESIYIQNSKLYVFGVFFNSITLFIINTYRIRLANCGLFTGHNIYSVLLMFTNAFYGLNMALILKFRDNMFQVFSNQVTTVVVVSASMYLMDFKPGLEFFLIAPIVLLAIFIYNSAKKQESSESVAIDCNDHVYNVIPSGDNIGLLAEGD
ncbi:unnamed protein product [Owenia fusiformis]|uniref:UDP-sugar transporter protein SLC35A5 n=1 Tax=Owenia fusiformis TaxID=6347 RepID=A0A8J1U189_OWEFU|nr:unnamed protein product [Owenia fusiformis]